MNPVLQMLLGPRARAAVNAQPQAIPRTEYDRKKIVDPDPVPPTASEALDPGYSQEELLKMLLARKAAK